MGMSAYEQQGPAAFESESEEVRRARGAGERETQALELIRAEPPGHEVEFIMPDTSDGALLFGEFDKPSEPTAAEGEVQHPKTLYRVLLPHRRSEKGSIQVLDIVENDETAREDGETPGVVELDLAA